MNNSKRIAKMEMIAKSNEIEPLYMEIDGKQVDLRTLSVDETLSIVNEIEAGGSRADRATGHEKHRQTNMRKDRIIMEARKGAEWHYNQITKLRRAGKDSEADKLTVTLSNKNANGEFYASERADDFLKLLADEQAKRAHVEFQKKNMARIHEFNSPRYMQAEAEQRGLDAKREKMNLYSNILRARNTIPSQVFSVPELEGLDGFTRLIVGLHESFDDTERANIAKGIKEAVQTAADSNNYYADRTLTAVITDGGLRDFGRSIAKEYGRQYAEHIASELQVMAQAEAARKDYLAMANVDVLE